MRFIGILTLLSVCLASGANLRAGYSRQLDNTENDYSFSAFITHAFSSLFTLKVFSMECLENECIEIYIKDKILSRKMDKEIEQYNDIEDP